jgi:hypothetical protein
VPAWRWSGVSITSAGWPWPPSRRSQRWGFRAADECARPPAQVKAEDFERADRVVALKRDEHLPLLQERFPAWAEMVEFWQVKDAREAVAVIEEEVLGLIARLLGGGNRPGADAPVASAQPRGQARSEPAKKPVTVKIPPRNRSAFTRRSRSGRGSSL